MLDRSSDTSRLVDRLCAKGWAKRSQCPTDRRLVDVVITEQGRDQLETVSNQMAKVDECLSGICEEDALKLSELLDQLRSGFSE